MNPLFGFIIGRIYFMYLYDSSKDHANFFIKYAIIIVGDLEIPAEQCTNIFFL